MWGEGYFLNVKSIFGEGRGERKRRLFLNYVRCVVSRKRYKKNDSAYLWYVRVIKGGRYRTLSTLLVRAVNLVNYLTRPLLDVSSIMKMIIKNLITTHWQPNLNGDHHARMIDQASICHNLPTMYTGSVIRVISGIATWIITSTADWRKNIC